MSQSTPSCACLQSLTIPHEVQQTNDQHPLVSSEDLLDVIDNTCRAWDQIRNCTNCQGDLAQSIKLLQLLGPVVNRLHILQAAFTAHDAKHNGKMDSDAQEEAKQARATIEKSAVRLGVFVVDDPDDLRIVWTVILKHGIFLVQNTLKAVRKHTQHKFDECRPSSVHMSFVRNQAAEVDSLIDDIQANIWKTLAKLDMGNFGLS